jgi:transposase-like protein
VIVTCVRWYLRFCLSFRDWEELMAEQGSPSITRRFGGGLRPTAPGVYRRLHGEVRRKSSTWHMDETFVRIAGQWMYRFRAIDSQGIRWTSICRQGGIAKPPSCF